MECRIAGEPLTGRAGAGVTRDAAVCRRAGAA